MSALGIRRVRSRMGQSAPDVWEVKMFFFYCCWLLLVARAACEGRKGLSDGVWFNSNVVELGLVDTLSGVERSSCALKDVAADGSCMEDRLSEVGIWTWAPMLEKRSPELDGVNTT
jgi:hypothetical protein